MSSRPTVGVFSLDGASAGQSVPLPAVFSAPVRLDVLQQVYKSVAKNKRQPYAVAREAGHQTSAESWGTGRAVARIPRVSGGGTSASGRAAFGNMVKGGRMFAPTRVWRRWHVKVNQNQRRFATVSALAATAIPSLVLARGHRIEGIEEVPLVISDSVQSVVKTKEAVAALKAVNAHADVTKVINSTKSRAGRGKTRGRRFQARRGPLVIYAEDNGLVKAFRNIPGVEVANVTRLNMLQLAPGGHLGRFCIWTESAFKALDSVYGTHETASEFKKGYTLPAAKIANPDIQRIINSTEVQSVLRAAGPRKVKRPFVQKKNPLKNQGVMFRLNPYAKAYKRRELLNLEKKRSGAPKAEKEAKKLSAGKTFLETLTAP